MNGRSVTDAPSGWAMARPGGHSYSAAPSSLGVRVEVCPLAFGAFLVLSAASGASEASPSSGACEPLTGSVIGSRSSSSSGGPKTSSESLAFSGVLVTTRYTAPATPVTTRVRRNRRRHRFGRAALIPAFAAAFAARLPMAELGISETSCERRSAASARTTAARSAAWLRVSAEVCAALRSAGLATRWASRATTTARSASSVTVSAAFSTALLPVSVTCFSIAAVLERRPSMVLLLDGRVMNGTEAGPSRNPDGRRRHRPPATLPSCDFPLAPMLTQPARPGRKPPPVRSPHLVGGPPGRCVHRRGSSGRFGERSQVPGGQAGRQRSVEEPADPGGRDRADHAAQLLLGCCVHGGQVGEGRGQTHQRVPIIADDLADVAQPPARQLSRRSVAEGELQLDRSGSDHTRMLAN